MTANDQQILHAWHGLLARMTDYSREEGIPIDYRELHPEDIADMLYLFFVPDQHGALGGSGGLEQLTPFGTPQPGCVYGTKEATA